MDKEKLTAKQRMEMKRLADDLRRKIIAEKITKDTKDFLITVVRNHVSTNSLHGLKRLYQIRYGKQYGA